MDTEVRTGNRKKRPNYSLDFKKRLAQAACAPGVSVSQLALEHGINANMLFKWRRHYRAGLLDAPGHEPSILLPVSVVDTHKMMPPQWQEQLTAPHHPAAPIQNADVSHGIIEIKFADVIVRLDGRADAATLRIVLQSLRT